MGLTDKEQIMALGANGLASHSGPLNIGNPMPGGHMGAMGGSPAKSEQMCKDCLKAGDLAEELGEPPGLTEAMEGE